MTHDDNKIRNSARELIERLGKAAVQYASDRIEQIKEQGDARELDQAYRLLTEVENQLNEGI
jgi:hypothetical protein